MLQQHTGSCFNTRTQGKLLTWGSVLWQSVLGHRAKEEGGPLAWARKEASMEFGCGCFTAAFRVN